MKKSYFIIYLAATIISSAFAFPETKFVIRQAGSLKQQVDTLTEIERLERCQNNKNRITELEAQLKTNDAELSQSMETREMEKTRDRLVEIRTFKNLAYKDANSADWNERLIRVGRIAAQYNFNLDDCIEDAKTHTNNPRGLCFAALEILIGKKIDKALPLQNKRPELVNKKNEIDNQLAFHRNNLIALRCNQTTFDFEMILVGDWDKDQHLTNSGTSHFSFPVTFFRVEKNLMDGRYGKNFIDEKSRNYGKITGGSFDEITGKLQFTFVQGMDKKTGTATLYLTETPIFYKLQGDWRLNDGSSGELKMKRYK